MKIRAASTMTMNTILIAASAAPGEMVVYDNSGREFEWAYNYDAGYAWTDMLDITRAPDDQVGSGESAFGFEYSGGLTSGQEIYERLVGSSVRSTETYEVWSWDILITVGGAAALGVGDVVGPDSNFGTNNNLVVTSGSYGSTAPPAVFVERDEYVGVSFTTGSGDTHYGWIQLGTGTGGWQPIAWGWQSTPGGAAVLLPAPGSAAVLALWCLTAQRRRQAA